jgi:hypothetical protein
VKNTFRAAIAAAAITSTAIAAFAEPITVPERLIGDLQSDLDLNELQAAGLVGNLARETGNFRYLQELNPLIRGSRGGLGYAQWTGPRRDAFVEYADGRDLMSYEINYGFLRHELEGPYAHVLDRLRQAGDEVEATYIVMRGYLAPHPKYRHLQDRIDFAVSYLNGVFDGAGCGSLHRPYEVNGIEALDTCPVEVDLASIRPRARPSGIGDPEHTASSSIAVVRPVMRPDRIGPSGASESGVELEEITVLDPFARPIGPDPSSS